MSLRWTPTRVLVYRHPVDISERTASPFHYVLVHTLLARPNSFPP